MKTILTSTALALLAAPALAATTEDLRAIRQPSSDSQGCFAPIPGTNAFQRTHAPGCIYYVAPTGNDRDRAASEPSEGGEGGESSDT
ncbi:hypothetical protein JMK10_00190 [Rhodovulum sulfidophilum]|uniref:hypothetical protein n=1 Tax=Rhodovulum sulfidophilum TaxID=35806 RepID=UPI00192206E5|nr:hypothetical protein [Rhodovulum sulfidophilum]MBL3576413.1 hypothetical protein [Rhodovulum sulfidophilum]MCE8433868.1 hypothetical protein [Rhodovulum sulfidophilum]MCF4115282.1 hypothetical protein [Rhodovulum sulfidophilum]